MRSATAGLHGATLLEVPLSTTTDLGSSFMPFFQIRENTKHPISVVLFPQPPATSPTSSHQSRTSNTPEQNTKNKEVWTFYIAIRNQLQHVES
ncbi:hypothetical protein BDU57DRAFT_515653 [Ampelomyces quisqualis]|uniref:Uncharacterized protein n=1 Tax=Ampelomyces quisqualis TaxID=50730 RepID=A0A6A5QLV5_AMPQU|nr:hypothetical protein BDU57DRAFT_515653 [Ampelomyces quisqualis]